MLERVKRRKQEQALENEEIILLPEFRQILTTSKPLMLRSGLKRSKIPQSAFVQTKNQASSAALATRN